MDNDIAMKSALSALAHAGLKKPNLSKIAREHGVDHQRLRRRLKNVNARPCCSVNKSLNPAQKQELVDWILRYSDRGFPLRPIIILNKASEIRRLIYPEAPNFHRSWISRLINQFSDQLKNQISSCIDMERTTAVSATSLKLYFDRVSECL